MKIGITYDLREAYLAEGYGEEETAEFDRPETIDAIDCTLRDLGFATDRIGHIKDLVRRLGAGDRWDLVFNIAEGLRGFGREAQVPALLEAYGITYTFSDPLVLSLALHKGMAKRIIRDFGIPTPDFAVVGSDEEFPGLNLPFPLFVKPVAEGTGKGISELSRISTPSDLHTACRGVFTRFGQPALVETFLPGREFTVGIVGTGKDAEVLGVMEVILRENAESDAYSYVNKQRYEELVEYRLVTDDQARRAGEVALSSWRALGCRDAGRVDLRADDGGVPNFIEVNPLAGLNPEHSDLPILCSLVGVSYRELLYRIMKSAILRIGPPRDLRM